MDFCVGASLAREHSCREQGSLLQTISYVSELIAIRSWRETVHSLFTALHRFPTHRFMRPVYSEPCLVKRNENDQHECELAKMMKGGFGMKILKYFVVSSLLLLQTSLCFAGSENVINFSILPDPIAHCHQYWVDFAVTENSTLGVIGAPECISDRPTFYGSNFTSFTNRFNRVMAVWKYAPHGAFEDGSFLMASVGKERDELKTAAGSAANVSFIVSGVHVGHQWFWRNGLNVTATLGIAHLERNSLDKNVSVTESVDGIDFLDKQTSSNTHLGVGLFFGWAF